MNLDKGLQVFKNKTLLITGGTGSFGQTVLDRFLDTDIKEIRVFSRDEKKQEDMRLGFNNPKLRFYIGDVRQKDSLEQAMRGVNYVFHAAALKQVPSCEFYPMEAIKTNILGTENVLAVAAASEVERVVVLSTDKAVYPINAMGLSKALAEKIMRSRARLQSNSKTILCATRYGNVIASRGSVIPLFVSQIKNNKAMTITDPDMTRFLMSLEDSVDLVLHAFKNCKQGDIFVQKAPASSISNLATALGEIFNKSSFKTDVIGTRQGEKLFETLISREEMSTAEDMGKYFRIPADNHELNYATFTSEGALGLNEFEDFTSHNAKQLSVEQIKKLLLSIRYIKEELNA